jgi:SagB-type dehydrogenase family enzyme
MVPHYRRPPSLVCYWREGALVAENYATRARTEISPFVLDVMTRLERWQPVDAIAEQLPRVSRDTLAGLLESLAEHELLDVTDTPTDDPPALVRAWQGWMPSAAHFHFATRDVKFTPRAITIKRLVKRARRDPPPPALKPPMAGADDAGRVVLPAPSLTGALPDLLLERRTWRRFGTRAVTREELSTLLGLTWRVQDWVDVEAWGRMALKTAPSGGARHSIEAYVVARQVKGLKAGIYHYQPASHELHLVRPKATAADIAAYLPRQDWYGAASALVLMTCVFERVQWRYPFARAYRTVLAEAGHHCQNFCLVATALGLAPFCTMALADTRIERDLRIDGVTEAVLYAAGVGTRPGGVAWAPWPDTRRTPLRTPAHGTEAAHATAAPGSRGKKEARKGSR